MNAIFSVSVSEISGSDLTHMASRQRGDIVKVCNFIILQLCKLECCTHDCAKVIPQSCVRTTLSPQSCATAKRSLPSS
jgi:hypothetical protein